MADIIGDLDADDEGMHVIEADQQFNESMLVTWFSKENDSGALVRIGNRPNEGYAEVTFCLFPEDGGALFQFARAPIDGNRDFNAGGLHLNVTKPTDVLEVTYSGSVSKFEDPRALADPGSAFKSAPRVDVELSVTGHAMTGIYGARSGTSVGGHYEQHMRMSGTLTIDGVGRDASGVGNRDHSWGPRNWHRTYMDRTLWCTFDDELAMAVSLTWDEPDGDPEVMGTIFRNGEPRKIVGGEISSEFEDNGLYHTAFECRLRDEVGDVLECRGRVVRFIPFRHRRDGHITHIGQGMTEFIAGAHRGYGLSEYMDLVQ